MTFDLKPTDERVDSYGASLMVADLLFKLDLGRIRKPFLIRLTKAINESETVDALLRKFVGDSGDGIGEAILDEIGTVPSFLRCSRLTKFLIK